MYLDLLFKDEMHEISKLETTIIYIYIYVCVCVCVQNLTREFADK